MVLLDNDAFLSELTMMIEGSRASGSVSVSTKRYIAKGSTEPTCLVRGVAPRGKKISTIVGHKEITKFQMDYGKLLRAGLSALKKKERKKRKKGSTSTDAGAASGAAAAAAQS